MIPPQHLRSLICAVAVGGCGVEATLGEAVSGGQFVEYVPAPAPPHTLDVRVSNHPGATVALGESTALTDESGWATLTLPPEANLRFAIVDSPPLSALVPPGATSVALDDRSTADVRLLRALAGDPQSADGLALMALLNSARSEGGAYYEQVTRQLLGLPNTAATELSALASDKAITPCVDDGAIRIVIQVRMADDLVDGNCAPIDRFRWATDIQAASMFITGGVHEQFEATHPQDALVAHEALGGWQPNLVPMHNSGDGLWTFVADLPRTTPPLQLGYKFTWGLKGSTWTGTEEWPGNQRLLEVVDVDGDGLVVVRDSFGDEASNKDRQNLRRGGLGAIGYDDPAAREHAVDLDGDCVADAFPRAANVSPLLGACADPGPPPPVDPTVGPVGLDSLTPQTGGNGGGALLTATGRGFIGGLPVRFDGVPAQATFVRSPTELLVVTPRLAVGAAALVVGGSGDPAIPFGVAGPADGSVPECAMTDVGGLPEVVGALHTGARFRVAAAVGAAAQGVVLSVEHLVSEALDEAGPAVRGRTVQAERGPDGQRYEATMVLPGPGHWTHGFQVSADAGRTWRACEDFGTFEVR